MCLSDAHKATIDGWMRSHDVACPVCKSKQLRSIDPVSIPRYGIGLGINPGGASEYPILRLVCAQCAHVLHFSARTVLNLKDESMRWV